VKYLTISTVVLFSFFLIWCDKNPSTSSDTKTEKWEAQPTGAEGKGEFTITMDSNGSLSTDGNWYFVYQGDTAKCPYLNGEINIAGAEVTANIGGKATILYNGIYPDTSDFDLGFNGNFVNGSAQGTWNIAFTKPLWPQSISGDFTDNSGKCKIKNIDVW
jgi:hypothetical protein